MQYIPCCKQSHFYYGFSCFQWLQSLTPTSFIRVCQLAGLKIGQVWLLEKDTVESTV